MMKRNFVKKMNRSLSAAWIAAFALGLPAHAEEQPDANFTYHDAAMTNLAASGKAGLTTAGTLWAKSKVEAALSEPIHDSSAVPTRLDQSTVDEVMKKLRNSKSSTAGFGSLGGAEIVIEYDNGHVERMLAIKNMEKTMESLGQSGQKISELAKNLSGGELHTGLVGDVRQGTTPSVGAVDQGIQMAQKVEPKFESKPINIRTAGLDGIEKQLKEIVSSGALVKKITYRTLPSKVLLNEVIPAVGLVSGVGAVERLMAGLFTSMSADEKARYSYQSSEDIAYCTPKTFCEKPTLIRKIFDSAPGAAYEKQTAAREAAAAAQSAE